MTCFIFLVWVFFVLIVIITKKNVIYPIGTISRVLTSLMFYLLMIWETKHFQRRVYSGCCKFQKKIFWSWKFSTLVSNWSLVYYCAKFILNTVEYIHQFLFFQSLKNSNGDLLEIPFICGNKFAICFSQGKLSTSLALWKCCVRSKDVKVCHWAAARSNSCTDHCRHPWTQQRKGQMASEGDWLTWTNLNLSRRCVNLVFIFMVIFSVICDGNEERKPARI